MWRLRCLYDGEFHEQPPSTSIRRMADPVLVVRLGFLGFVYPRVGLFLSCGGAVSRRHRCEAANRVDQTLAARAVARVGRCIAATDRSSASIFMSISSSSRRRSIAFSHSPSSAIALVASSRCLSDRSVASSALHTSARRSVSAKGPPGARHCTSTRLRWKTGRFVLSHGRAVAQADLRRKVTCDFSLPNRRPPVAEVEPEIAAAAPAIPLRSHQSGYP
jgi:hypothetical protein